jgi:hypothetical protein
MGFACGARTDLGVIEDDEAGTDAAAECQAPVTAYGGSFFDTGCHRFKTED